MISIKKHLLILFCLLTTLTNCAKTTTTTTYPEVEGYIAHVPITDYFQEIEENHYTSTKIPETIIYSKNSSFNFTKPTQGYKKDLKIDKIEFTPEDRTLLLDTFTKKVMDGMSSVYCYDSTHAKVGETGYMFICFKDPKNNNKKTYIKLHVKRVY